jgi:hypothetical protein
VKPTTTGIYHGASPEPLSAEEQKAKSESDKWVESMLAAALDGLNSGAMDEDIAAARKSKSPLKAADLQQS